MVLTVVLASTHTHRWGSTGEPSVDAGETSGGLISFWASSRRSSRGVWGSQ